MYDSRLEQLSIEAIRNPSAALFLPVVDEARDNTRYQDLLATSVGGDINTNKFILNYAKLFDRGRNS